MYTKDLFALSSSVIKRHETLKNYVVGDRVIFNNKVYECTTNHTSSVTGFENDKANWELIIGNEVDVAITIWADGEMYDVGDVVAHQGMLYQCIKKHRATDPFNEENWELIVEGGGAGGTTPVVAIMPYMGDTAPEGYLLCDGRAVSRATYDQLFAVIGTTYGTGNGSTTFNLPNLKGRVPVGFDASSTEFNTLGKIGGEKTHKLLINEMPSHSHTFTGNSHTHTTNNSGSHSHSYTYPQKTNGFPDGGNDTGGSYGYWRYTTTANTGGGGSHTHTVNGTFVSGSNSNTGGDVAHNNLQPYMVVNYIIRYKRNNDKELVDLDLDNWYPDTYYIDSACVVYGGGIYKCTNTHTSSADFIVDGANWKLLTQIDIDFDEWQQNKLYNQNALVIYNNKIYKCNIAHTSGTTFDATMFDIILDHIKEYQNGDVYTKHTMVCDDHDLYISKVDNASNLENWTQFDKLQKANAKLIENGDLKDLLKAEVTGALRGEVMHFMTNDDTNITGLPDGSTTGMWFIDAYCLTETSIRFIAYKAFETNTKAVYSTNLIANYWDDKGWVEIGSDSKSIRQWSANTDYEVGDTVDYRSVLYKCTTAHTSGNTFTQGNFEQYTGGLATVMKTISFGDCLQKIYEDMKDTTFHGGEYLYFKKSYYVFGDCTNTPTSDGGCSWNMDAYGDASGGMLLIAYQTPSNATHYGHHGKIYVNQHFNIWQGWNEIGSGGGIDDWAANTTYAVGDIVKTDDNRILVCNTAHTSSTDIDKTTQWIEFNKGTGKNISGDAKALIFADMANAPYCTSRNYYCQDSCTNTPIGGVGWYITTYPWDKNSFMAVAYEAYGNNVDVARANMIWTCRCINGTWNVWVPIQTARKATFSGVDAFATIATECSQLGDNSIKEFYFFGNSTNIPITSYEWHVTAHYRSANYIYCIAYRQYGTTDLNNSVYIAQRYGGTWYGWYSISNFGSWNNAYTWSVNLINRMPSYSSAWSINCNGWPTYRGTISSTNYMKNSECMNISQGMNETSGIQFNGDYIAMWSPCDAYSLTYVDEDNAGSSYVFYHDTSGRLYTASDIRRKKNIQYVEREDVLDKIDAINLCTFQYNTYEDAIVDTEYETKANEVASDVIYEYLDDETKERYENKEDYYAKEKARLEKKAKRVDSKDAKVHYGVIAQEIQEFFPECVEEDDQGYLSVSYEKFGLYAIEGVKALHKENKELKNEVEDLKAKNDDLEKRLAYIEEQLGLR